MSDNSSFKQRRDQPFCPLRRLFSHRRTNYPKCSNLTLSFFAGHVVFLRHTAFATFLPTLPSGLHHVTVWKEQSQLHSYNVPISQQELTINYPKSQNGFNYAYST
jgi:hypothetical protein